MPKRNGFGIELLADPTRRRIIALLAVRPWHASAIAEEIGLSRPATTRQLHLLEDAGLIRRSWITRDGRRRLFTMAVHTIGPITAWLAGVELDGRGSIRSYAAPRTESDVASPPIVPFDWNDPTAALQRAHETGLQRAHETGLQRAHETEADRTAAAERCSRTGSQQRSRPAAKACDTPGVGAMSAEADRLEAAAAAMLELAPRIEAGTPWPLAEMYGPEPEASWNPPELLAHVEEYLPYWLGEIERVLAGDGGMPVPFGRVATDAVRIGVIGRDRTVPLRELLARIESDAPRVAARLRELSDADAARKGLHPTRGEMTVRDMLEPFLVGHTEGHVSQLREILDAAGR